MCGSLDAAVNRVLQAVMGCCACCGFFAASLAACFAALLLLLLLLLLYVRLTGVGTGTCKQCVTSNTMHGQ
jgi:hypothetical protein